MPQATFKTIDSIDVAGKRVLVRVDLNVPMKNGKVTDATRIERAAPTLSELAAKGAKVIVLSHFGRPDGKRVPEMSLKPLVEPLSKALGKPVAFAEDCIGPLAEEAVRTLKPGEVLLLENLRFHKEEEKNDAGFIDKLSVLGDAYVNDAFSAAHRAHASTEGLANRLPAAAGRLMQAELEALDKALGNPKRPVCAVVGGAKVSTKLDLLGNLVGKVGKLIIGGGMANTFLQAQGINVGKSLSEKDLAGTAREIMAKAKAANCEILLPVDVVVAERIQGRRAEPGGRRQGLPRRPDDPGCRPEVDQDLRQAGRQVRHAGVERPARRLRDQAVRQRHRVAGAHRGRPDQRQKAPVGGRRRRHGGGAGRGRRRGEVLLCLDGGRRLPGMDGRQDPARRCGADTGGVGLLRR